MKTRVATWAIGAFLSAVVVHADPEDARFCGGSYDGWDRSAMAAAVGLFADVSLSSGTNQVFDWNQVAPALASLTITATDPAGTITNGGTIHVSVPVAWRCRFDAGSAVSCSGNATGKVGAVSFSGDQRTLLIPVTNDFEAGDTLTVSGLKMADLRLVPADTQRLELDYTGDGVRDEYDIYTLQVREQQWPGGSYDGWDRQATAEYESLVGTSGSLIVIH